MTKRVLAVSLVLLVLLSQFNTGVSEAEEDACTFNTLVEGMLARTNLPAYSSWISRVSGAVPVLIGNSMASLDTRYTHAMFLAQSENALAFEYIEQQVRRYLLDSQVYQHTYTMYYLTDSYTAVNLVVDLPGAVHPDEVVVLSAHLDSTSEIPWTLAPGADDNATGVAALLEAVRLFRNYRFDRTIRLIWFTGEEQGLRGSSAYVNDPAVDLSQIVGNINLDMFGYDKDEDSCFEIHVGTMAASDLIGQCMVTSINVYGAGLQYDYIMEGATTRSDHASFWSKSIGAVEVLENAYSDTLPGGCAGTDLNPNYHRTSDLLENLHPSYAYQISRAAIATVAGLAGPLSVCLDGASPRFHGETSVAMGEISLHWNAVTDATAYRVFRSTEACGGEVTLVADVSGTSWEDQDVFHGRTYHYWVEAISPQGCFSLSDGCASLTAVAFPTFFPLIGK